MKRLAGMAGAAALLCAVAPGATATHAQDPYCQWGSTILPQEEVLTVTLEGPRWFEDCPGWRVGVSAAGSDEVAVQTYRDAPEAPSPPADRGPGADRSKKKAGKRRCASHAKSKKAKKRSGRSKCRRKKKKGRSGRG